MMTAIVVSQQAFLYHVCYTRYKPLVYKPLVLATCMANSEVQQAVSHKSLADTLMHVYMGTCNYHGFFHILRECDSVVMHRIPDGGMYFNVEG